MVISQTTFLSILLVVFLSALPRGEALQCVEGSSSTSFSHKECSGTCINTTVTHDDRTEILRACSPVHIDDRCDDFSALSKTKTCYCNWDLCNTISGSDSGNSAFSRTSPLLLILLVPYLVHKFL
ncbi:uncharacterized protein [Panulirus ornatus]|uniref:uncharacterized protein n=1 Tax=Panulirus ornatus TaxID=150431 RepID=UPI003A83FA4B